MPKLTCLTIWQPNVLGNHTNLMSRVKIYITIAIITALVVVIALEMSYLLRTPDISISQKTTINKTALNPEEEARRENIKQIAKILENSYSLKEVDFYRNLLAGLSKENNVSHTSTLYNTFIGKVINIDLQPGALSEITPYEVKLEIQFNNEPIRTIYYTEDDLPKIQIKTTNPQPETDLTISDIKPGDMVTIDEVSNLNSLATTSIIITKSE
ncbi:hypothetical protein COV49_01285 [Candidatus Falkowbacteria bacterium CG11_big_fil_rev_8_21_14_0_20_39_10]|uniref:Uncharacterized protein n=1 Tax=Candidatus Falkowbacteria bacterium CG11_big_fil_rev_8_21_14_0_20_39_10 TaxID=1974570 RepID=A0A2M6K9Y7_9BACT|nr:MAG: hypothetical protein COV49_01285 [Candidatus Falkowbacteria bacterium CG11_big_fil_rev_8_21_14_0_20_39_10]